MAGPVLIVSPESDLHGRIVAERLREQQIQVDFWGSTLFPWMQRAAWSPGGSLMGGLGAPPDLSIYHKIWWRRYKRPTPPPSVEDPHVKSFCASEAEQMMRGIFSLQKGRIVNDPERERTANRKVYQLQCAYDVGLLIPATMVSNDVKIIRDFVSDNARTIVKPISSSYPHSIETRECTLGDFNDENAVGLAPHIYQELVEAVLDIRVFTVGDQVFAGELERGDTNTKVDWRMLASGWRKHNLDPRCAGKLIELNRILGLDTASFDLRLNNNGEYVFLEINPSGQFLFLEIDCKLPLSAALASFLSS